MNNKSYFSKVWSAISVSLFNTTGYSHDRNAFDNKLHDNYDVTDTTEIRLISSRRTFL
ncbi:hypothetical protein [Clostridium saccharoperbutylacetonicum]|jgi:hypothetical protein|uniref:hypothetical protein n=1 Tax=Clostridium saccharoperbutylacetonicum TaxID=36745 RepID=UPI0039E77D0E